ncbi:DUF4062 domain-containing protein [Sphingorhabdus sp.]|uniref:DUF4062 domain-containing protein n=1 Tax=Sphingorhabdus sp. TaxID=1902408 RepID=UPI003BAF7439
MSYNLKAIEVMISSPSDVEREREAVRSALADWNAAHARKRKICLLPVGWDTHIPPQFGRKKRPQDIINKKALAGCDILVGVFWTRIGSHTGQEISGSVEEIKFHVRRKKRTMLYFCDLPVPSNLIDVEQQESLKNFRVWASSNAIVRSYLTYDDFLRKLYQDISITMNGYRSNV